MGFMIYPDYNCTVIGHWHPLCLELGVNKIISRYTRQSRRNFAVLLKILARRPFAAVPGNPKEGNRRLRRRRTV